MKKQAQTAPIDLKRVEARRSKSASPEGDALPLSKSPRTPEKSPKSPKSPGRLSLLLQRRSSASNVAKAVEEAVAQDTDLDFVPVLPRMSGQRNSGELNLWRRSIGPRQSDSVLRVSPRTSISVDELNEEDAASETLEYEFSGSASLESLKGVTIEGSSSMDTVSPRNVSEGALLPILQVPHGGLFGPLAKGGEGRLTDFLKGVYGTVSVVHEEGSGQPFWRMSDWEGQYMIYAKATEQVVALHLLMEHMGWHDRAKVDFGQTLIAALKGYNLGLGRAVDRKLSLSQPLVQTRESDVTSQIKELRMALEQFARETVRQLMDLKHEQERMARVLSGKDAGN